MREPSIQAMGYGGVLKAPPMGPEVEPQKPKLICIEKNSKKLWLEWLVWSVPSSHSKMVDLDSSPISKQDVWTVAISQDVWTVAISQRMEWS